MDTSVRSLVSSGRFEEAREALDKASTTDHRGGEAFVLNLVLALALDEPKCLVELLRRLSETTAIGRQTLADLIDDPGLVQYRDDLLGVMDFLDGRPRDAEARFRGSIARLGADACRLELLGSALLTSGMKSSLVELELLRVQHHANPQEVSREDLEAAIGSYQSSTHLVLFGLLLVGEALVAFSERLLPRTAGAREVLFFIAAVAVGVVGSFFVIWRRRLGRLHPELVEIYRARKKRDFGHFFLVLALFAFWAGSFVWTVLLLDERQRPEMGALGWCGYVTVLIVTLFLSVIFVWRWPLYVAALLVGGLDLYTICWIPVVFIDAEVRREWWAWLFSGGLLVAAIVTTTLLGRRLIHGPRRRK